MTVILRFANSLICSYLNNYKATRKLKPLLVVMFVSAIFGCEKTEEIIDVQVKTKEITSVVINSAASGGVIVNIDTISILEVGVCWDTISLPTITSNKTVESVQDAPNFEFNSTLKNLVSSKAYYVRAYAKTNDGVFYGNQLKFSTLSLDSLLVDFDYKLNQNQAPCKLTIINNSQFADGFKWSFEGATTVSSDVSVPTDIEYTSGGSYVITLTGCSASNCKTVSKTIVIENSEIEFNDQVLEELIRVALNRPTGPITKTFASTVTKLDLSRTIKDTAFIVNIDALQYFTSLKELNLFNNKVYDLTPIANLTNLELLILTNNEVATILPLANLINLKELNLWSNYVEDIQSLAKLTKMENLNIGANMIKDITPIKGNTSIYSLWLNSNAYTVDTTTIMSLKNLTTLGVTGCKLNSIDFAKDLTTLEDLLFENNYITDISALKNLTHLRSLFCGGNTIKDFRVLENLYNNGCFKLSAKFTYHINVTNNRADLMSNTENRRIIDLLANKSVKINWKTGNTY